MSNKISNKRKLFSAIVLTVGLFVVLLGSMIDSNNYKSTNVIDNENKEIAVGTGCVSVINKNNGSYSIIGLDNINCCTKKNGCQYYVSVNNGSYFGLNGSCTTNQGKDTRSGRIFPGSAGLTFTVCGVASRYINAYTNGNVTVACSGSGCDSSSRCNVAKGTCTFTATPFSGYNVSSSSSCTNPQSKLSYTVNSSSTNNINFYACLKQTTITKAKYVYAKNRSGNDKLNVTCYSSAGACENSSTCNVSKGTCTFTATAQSNYNVSRNSDCSYKQNKLVDSVSTGSSDINYYACPVNSQSGGTTTNCKINVEKQNSNETWNIYDNGQKVASNLSKYDCKSSSCYVVFTSIGDSFKGLAGDGDCSTGVRTTGMTLYCTNNSISAKACYNNNNNQKNNKLIIKSINGGVARISKITSGEGVILADGQTAECTKEPCEFLVTAGENYVFGYGLNGSSCTNNLQQATITVSKSDTVIYACPKNSHSSSGGTYTPVPEPSVEDNKTVTKNQFFYANGNQYQGNSIKCGDKVYVTTCSKGDNAICNVTSINEVFVSTTTQIYEKDLVANEKDTGCYQKIERYIAEKTYYYSDRELSINKTEIACGSVVTFKQEIKNACVNKSCEVEYNGKTVYINIDYITSDKPACQNQNISDGNTGGNTGGNTKTCVTSKNVTGAKGEVPVSICKKDDTEDTRNKIVSCAEDYEFKYKLTNDTCKDSNSDNCYKDYLYTCSYIKRPGVNASAGTVGSNGKGIITVTGVPYGNIGILGYHVSSGDEPTVNSGWSTFNAINNSFSIERSAGTYFIWAINNKRRISYPVLAKVYDADLSTTLASFKVQDGNGNDINTNISSLDGTVGYTTGVKDSKYALLSNSLIADSVGGFDKLTTSYELSVNSNKIALYATLTSSDASYVSGYEPRTIDLEYGRNVALIKIVNKDGKERCYTFIINRVDDRNNSNLLKNIKLSRGSIDFDPYTTNYDVKISRFTKKVSVNAELDSSTSTFIKGYEPREVEITEDRQSVVLKVISEAGSIRSYVITFIRNGEDKDNINSTYLSSLTVPGTMLGFDKETYDYTITVPYETEDLPIYAFAESETASVTVGNNTGLKVGNNLIQIEVKNNNKTRIYSLHVIRKESGLDISDSAKLGTLSIKNYNIEFSPDKLDYEVKIKREKTLLISATPESNRADIYMYGNNDLTGFSTIRVKVIAENGLTNIYSIDIQKAAYNKKIEIIASVAGVSALLIVSLVIYLKKKNNKRKEYLEG